MIMSIFNRKIEIKEVKCPACGEMFKASERQIFIPKKGDRGLMCKGCTKLMRKLNEYRSKLPNETKPGKIKKLSKEIKRLEKRLKLS